MAMKEKKNNNFGIWTGILLGVVAILAIKSIFEDDNSKIISKKGRKLLSDDDKMKDLNEKILNSEDNNHHQEILI